MRQRIKMHGHKNLKRQIADGWEVSCLCGWTGELQPAKHAADIAYRGHLSDLMLICKSCDQSKMPKEMSKARDGICKACSNAKTRAWKAANPNEWDRHARKYHLRAKYGIDESDFDKMMADQDRKCAICSCDISDRKGQRPHIDHCHDNGKVRGLLCPQCNWGLGAFRDDLAIVQAAVAYLERGG